MIIIDLGRKSHKQTPKHEKRSGVCEIVNLKTGERKPYDPPVDSQKKK